MMEFGQQVRLTMSYSVALLVVAAIGWALYPAYQLFLAGYVVGAAAGIMNSGILAVKTAQVSEYALGQRKRRPGTGMLQRFLIAGFAAYVVFKFPAYFHIAGFFIGLMTSTLLTLVLSLVYYVKKRLRTERGEK